MKLSIIIPCYNEEKTILEVISRINKVNIKNITKEIIIINDGSTDGTIDKIKNINDILIVNHIVNKGKGKAIKTALDYASGDLIIIQDADLEYDPFEYPNLIKPFESNKVDVVYGSRNLKKNDYSLFSFYIGGIIITKIANILYPNAKLTDLHTCYKIFRKKLISDLTIESTGFEFCPEITAKILNKKILIKEVPISYYPRSKKEGKKIKWRDGIIALYILIKYKFSK